MQIKKSTFNLTFTISCYCKFCIKATKTIYILVHISSDKASSIINHSVIAAYSQAATIYISINLFSQGVGHGKSSSNSPCSSTPSQHAQSFVYQLFLQHSATIDPFHRLSPPDSLSLNPATIYLLHKIILIHHIFKPPQCTMHRSLHLLLSSAAYIQ